MKITGPSTIITLTPCRLLAVLFAVISGLFATAMTPLDSLKDVLSRTKSPADSIPVLFNIYDCTLYSDRGPVLEDIYHTATNIHDDRAKLDALILMSAIYAENDSLQTVLRKRVEAIPQSDAQRSTAIYIKVKHAGRIFMTSTESKRRELLHKCFLKYKDIQRLGLYDRIEYLFYLCTYLRSTSDGEMLIKYLKELQALIDSLPTKELSLRALFYSQAALSYLSNGMIRESVEANKKMLEVNKEYDRKHEAEGRIYRDYSGSTYSCYHRMLMCHNVLTQAEIDTCYTRMLRLEHTRNWIHEDADLTRRSHIYYLMAKKRYKEAIPLIKFQLKRNNTVFENNYLAEALIESAEALGNKSDMLLGLKIGNRLLNEHIEAKADESYKELQILYEINDLRQKNDDLEIEKKFMDAKYSRGAIILTVASLGVVLLLLLAVFRLYRKSRRLSKRLSEANANLTNERDTLKRAHDSLIIARDQAKAADRVKSDFVNNMSNEIRTPLAAIVEYSHLVSDSAEDDPRQYIRHYSDILSHNTDLLTTLVNDVLDLPSLENSEPVVTISPCSPAEICRMTVDMVKRYVAPGVSLEFAGDSDDDTMILTDKHKVEQVLLNLLTNAAKFTEKGSIVLAYRLSADGHKITFSVTDTGLGIPRGQEEYIFSRFSKLNPATQGNGLGLYISRLLTDILKGELRVDPSYRKGARFTFTIPVS